MDFRISRLFDIGHRTAKGSDLADWTEREFDKYALLPRLAVVMVLLLAAFGHDGASHWLALLVYGASTILSVVMNWTKYNSARHWIPNITTVVDGVLAVYVIGYHLPQAAQNYPVSTDTIGMLPAFLFLLQTGFRLRRKFVALFTAIVAVGWGWLIFLLASRRLVLTGTGPAAETGDILNLMVFLAAAAFVLNGVGWINDAVEAALQAQKERFLFSRFLPDGVALDIVRGGNTAVIAERHACLLGVDIRGSSELAREYSSADSIAWLLDFRRMVHEEVLRERGIVDKYMGDGVLSLFLHGSEGEQAANILNASRAIFSQLDQWNARRVSECVPKLNIVISIHSGRVLAGVFDDGHRSEFTVLGPAVNELSRIERCAKQSGIEILASRVFIELLPLNEQELTVSSWLPSTTSEGDNMRELAVVAVVRR